MKKNSKFFAPRGRGVEGRHSSPPILFDKKLRKVGLFLRTFVGIKINASIQKLLASQGFDNRKILNSIVILLSSCYTAQTVDDMILL